MPWMLRTGLLLAGAVAIWFAVFLGIAYAAAELVEAVEGETSECWSSQCGPLGEFQDDHDLVAVIVMGFLAALPAAAFLRRMWPRSTSRDPKPSELRGAQESRTRRHSAAILSKVKRLADPYRDLDVIDSRAPRFNQATIGTLSAIAATTLGLQPRVLRARAAPLR